MTNFNLFSEIYGCYFSVIEKLIKQAKDGMSKNEIENLIQSEAFYDSAFYLLPKIFSTDWAFVEEKPDNKFYTKENLNTLVRPLTNLEKSWLKAILLDAKIQLFISKEELNELNLLLENISPLFIPSDFYIFDSANDGDNFTDETYITNFKIVLDAIKKGKTVQILYDSSREKTLHKTVLPYKIIYSSRDDKFRLIGTLLQSGSRQRNVTLNFGRIISCEQTDYPLDTLSIKKEITTKIHSEPITLCIYKKRSALERFMLEFAMWEKETEYDEENDVYICNLFYEKQDEPELLIRILGFGPVIKVLGNENFLAQIKERVFKQYEFNNKQTE